MNERKLDVVVLGLVIVFALSGLNLFAQESLSQQEINQFAKSNSLHHPFMATGKEFILSDNPIFPNLKITSSE